MRQWEAASWAAGRSQEDVIARAGGAVARVATGLTRAGDSILVLAGRGHNGDDARQAARQLPQRKVKLIEVGDPAATARALPELLEEGPALIIDGLFGIGLNRPLDEAWVEIIRVLNASRVPILAVDVPSGLDAATGQPMPVAIEAAVTVTLGAPKAGLLASSAWPYVGRLEVARDIGLLPCPLKAEKIWTMATDFAAFPPPRHVADHKGSHGHLAIVAGSVGFHGAAVLAARGAQRAQPGLITLCVPETIYVPVAARLESVMVRPWRGEPELPQATALVAGPGLAGPEVDSRLREFVRRAWREWPGAMIVDASALDWLEPGAVRVAAPRVLTPHPGEAARLLGISTAAVQGDRLSALRKLSAQWGGAWVVLKGHQTLIGCREGEVAVNSSGNPHLAQGGSGDLLAGFLGGLLAQPRLQREVSLALRYAVWRHGTAADCLSARCSSWTVEELADELGAPRPDGENASLGPEPSAIHPV